ncbi:MAG: response regulator, partial [Chloroflexota bacterium]
DIFIIDDDTHNLHYYQSVINHSEGMRCIGSTTNSQNAVAIVVTTMPDIVLIDYALYPTSGFEIATLLKESVPDLPVVLLGGRPTLQEHAEKIGAFYIPMPITPRKLLDAIQEAITV